MSEVKRRKSYKSVDFRKIYQKYYVEKELNIEQIAKETGINSTTLTRRFKALNLDLYRLNKINYSTLRRDAFNTWDVETAYWLGFLVTRANIYENNIKVVLSETSKEHLIKLAKFLGLKKDCISYVKRSDSYTTDAMVLRFTDKILRDRLVIRGVHPNRELRNRDYTDIVPPNFLLPFILGVYDGDGAHVEKGIKFEGFPKLMHTVKDYFETFHGFTGIKTKVKKGKRLEIMWSNRKLIKKFIKLYINTLGVDIPIKRQMKKFEGIIPFLDYNPKENQLKKGRGRKGVKPSKEVLMELLQTKTILDISVIYEVTYTTTYIWCRDYGLLPPK